MSSADEQVHPVADIEIDSSGDGVYVRFIYVTHPRKFFESEPLLPDDHAHSRWFAMADSQLDQVYRSMGKVLKQKMLDTEAEQSPGVH